MFAGKRAKLTTIKAAPDRREAARAVQHHWCADPFAAQQL